MSIDPDIAKYEALLLKVAAGTSTPTEEDLVFRKLTLSEIREDLASRPGAKPRRRVRRRLTRVSQGRLPARPFYKSLWGLSIMSLAVAMIALINTSKFKQLVEPYQGAAYKGPQDPALLLFKQNAADDPSGHLLRLSEGAEVRANDTLLIKYRSAGYTHGMVFSISGDTAITLHYPASMDASTALPAREDAEAALAPYTLSNSPVFERFYLVLSKQPFQVNDIWQAVQDATRDEVLSDHIPGIPSGFRQWSIALRKQTHPL